MTEDEVARWLAWAGAQQGVIPEAYRPGVISLKVGDAVSLDLGDFPAAASLELTDVGAQGTLMIRSNQSQPDLITLYPSRKLTALDFRSDQGIPFADVQVAAAAASPITFKGSPIAKLYLPDGNFINALSITDFLWLNSTHLELQQGLDVKSLRLQGEVQLTGNTSVTAALTTVIGDSAEITGTARTSFSLGEVTFSEPCQQLRLNHWTGSLRPPAQTKLSLHDCTFRVPVGTEVSGIIFSGSGTIGVAGVLVESQFGEGKDQSDFILQVAEGAQVLTATGIVRLWASPRSVVIGKAEQPLVLREVAAAEASEISYVDIYQLGLTDLPKLATADRFVPELFSPRKARAEQMKMMLGARNEDLARVRRAHFWRRLVGIVSDTHAPGSLQSDVRLASGRARRRSLIKWRRERILLTLYSWVGYGERISQPLVLLLLGSLLVTAAIGPTTGRNSIFRTFTRFSASWHSVILSPLAFFHVVEAPRAKSIAAQLSLVTFELLGLVLFYFILSAIRRVAKAE